MKVEIEAVKHEPDCECEGCIFNVVSTSVNCGVVQEYCRRHNITSCEDNDVVYKIEEMRLEG